MVVLGLFGNLDSARWHLVSFPPQIVCARKNDWYVGPWYRFFSDGVGDWFSVLFDGPDSLQVSCLMFDIDPKTLNCTLHCPSVIGLFRCALSQCYCFV